MGTVTRTAIRSTLRLACAGVLGVAVAAATATAASAAPVPAPSGAATVGAAGRPVPDAVAASLSYAPCDPAGVSAADNDLANAVRQQMNGVRMGSSVTGYNVSCARVITRTVADRGLDKRAAVIAVGADGNTVAIYRSTNGYLYEEYMDHATGVWSNVGPVAGIQPTGDPAVTTDAAGNLNTVAGTGNHVLQQTWMDRNTGVWAGAQTIATNVA